MHGYRWAACRFCVLFYTSYGRVRNKTQWNLMIDVLNVKCINCSSAIYKYKGHCRIDEWWLLLLRAVPVSPKWLFDWWGGHVKCSHLTSWVEGAKKKKTEEERQKPKLNYRQSSLRWLWKSFSTMTNAFFSFGILIARFSFFELLPFVWCARITE